MFVCTVHGELNPEDVIVEREWVTTSVYTVVDIDDDTIQIEHQEDHGSPRDYTSETFMCGHCGRLLDSPDLFVEILY